MTTLALVVDALDAVRDTTRRTVKRDALAGLLAAVDPDDIVTVIGFVVGEIRQGRIGLGWASIRDLRAGSTGPALTVDAVDTALSSIEAMTGAGSRAARTELLSSLYARATSPEADFLGRLIVGELRTGALEGVVTDAVAVASGMPLAAVRRAAMLAGDLAVVARTALIDGADALDRIGLEPLRAVQPMLASTSESVAAALADVGEASVEWKLDGARIQVHRAGDDVAVFTRNLHDITDRLPEVVALVRSFEAHAFVLDGEVLGFMGPDQTPAAFQDTMSRFGGDDRGAGSTRLVPQFFDLLHLDGVDQIGEPLIVRRARLERLVGAHLIPGVITADAGEGQRVLDEALARGHEGVMVKAADSIYDAGRRGKSWRKVKPVHTLDLVVLAVEWGSGRRQGWLSNIHLGARDTTSGSYVMVGKTFKGMTDAMLEWQTERFRALATRATARTVWLAPVQVVEIAVDGAQASTRYPGGVALRFARVKGYRDDKPATEADTLDAVRALLPRGRSDRSD